MIRRILCFLCAMLLGLSIAPSAYAVADPDHPCSLTISYIRENVPFVDLPVEIYRVAELGKDGEHSLLAPYDDYPVEIHGITSQEQWQDTAQTLKNYIAADQIEAAQVKNTDENGQVCFEDLLTGLYLVKGVTAERQGQYFAFQDFMVYLPTPTDSEPLYDVEVSPKCTQYMKPEKYTVVKLWKDSAYSEKRPQSILIDILKDGVVQESITLNSGNNWSYSWEDKSGKGEWTVVEKDVPAVYRVAITKDSGTFIVTNTWNSFTPGKPNVPKPEKPETGDTAPIFLYMIILCVSGFGLLLLGILRLRDRRDEKKR